QGLRSLPRMKETLTNLNTPLMRRLGGELDVLADLCGLLEKSLVDEPPVRVSDGNIIRDGYSPELDEIRSVSRNSRDWIAELRAREAERTGVDKLKISYNRVFGYYIELTHAQLRSMPGGAPPDDYVRKQTLANGERYITPELKEKEDIILHAEE